MEVKKMIQKSLNCLSDVNYHGWGETQKKYDARMEAIKLMESFLDNCEGGLDYCPVCLKEVEEKIMTVDELKDLWNSQADHMNQWDELGLDEIVAFAQTKIGEHQ